MTRSTLPVLLTTVACATVPQVQPPASPQPIRLPDGTVKLESTFTAADGLELFTRSWRPPEPRAALVLVHGLKDHGERYEALALALAGKGVAVHAADLRGHARSAGERVYVDSFAEYLDDLAVQVKRVRAIEGDVPLFVFGHSMGGAIVTRWALETKPTVEGLVLSAPALAVDPETPGALLAISRFLSVIAPGSHVAALDVDGFSRDPEVLEAMRADPLVDQRKLPARTAVELVDTLEFIQGHMNELSLPFLVMHGSLDTITQVQGSRDLHARASSTDKSLRIYDGLVHDLLHEPEKEMVLSEVVAWVTARLPTPAEKATP